MDEVIYDKYKTAGEVAKKARTLGASLIKENVSFFDVVEQVESLIVDNGCGLAFPTNISVNEIAAHFTPRHIDKNIFFKKGDVVKLDVGAHVDGYIADTAVTVEIGTNNFSDMIKASQLALEKALGKISAKTALGEIGSIIQDTIESMGFKSVENLSGHKLQRYNLHSGLSVPNVGEKLNIITPSVDDVLAVEPFATNGAGHVISGDTSNIYRYVKSIRSKIIRDSNTRLFASRVNQKFGTLPFAERWCSKVFSNSEIVLKKLLFAGCIHQYPQLIDEKKGIVTQAEHTVIIYEDCCEVTT